MGSSVALSTFTLLSALSVSKPFHPQTQTLDPLNFPFSPPSGAWLPPFTLHAACVTWTWEVLHTSGAVSTFSVWLISLSAVSSRCTHTVTRVMHSCSFLWLNSIPSFTCVCMYLPYFVSPYKSWYILGLVPSFGYCESCCCVHGHPPPTPWHNI